MPWEAWMYVAAVIGCLAALFWPMLIKAWRDNTGSFAAGDPFWIRVAKVAFLALVISLIASAFGFYAFLQDDATRKTLKELGGLAYFSAFNYGFSAASLISEPLKKK